jgi:hypothetical protein
MLDSWDFPVDLNEVQKKVLEISNQAKTKRVKNSLATRKGESSKRVHYRKGNNS